ncbi:capsid cement protein [Knoellia sp. LjRoot47]|uniref:capsid cement protein n=1 Tax=Knoellia sp. LjRoot47 TaxID=3342330 RepID=UPI003ECD36B2
MRNEYMRPATELSLPVVASTVSGDPVRVGSINGVAATNRGEGGNASTHATVITDQRAYLYEVGGAIAGPGTPVYLTARAGATAPILSTTASGAVWGHTIPKAGETGVRAATSGVVVVRPAQV